MTNNNEMASYLLYVNSYIAININYIYLAMCQWSSYGFQSPNTLAS